MSNVLMIAQKAPTIDVTSTAKTDGSSRQSDGFADAFKGALDKADRPTSHTTVTETPGSAAPVETDRPRAQQSDVDAETSPETPVVLSDDDSSEEPDSSDLTQTLAEQVVAVAAAEVAMVDPQVQEVMPTETASAVQPVGLEVVQAVPGGQPMPADTDALNALVEGLVEAQAGPVDQSAAPVQASAPEPLAEVVQQVLTEATPDGTRASTDAQVQATTRVQAEQVVTEQVMPEQADAVKVGVEGPKVATDEVVQALSPKVTAVETAETAPATPQAAQAETTRANQPASLQAAPAEVTQATGPIQAQATSPEGATQAAAQGAAQTVEVTSTTTAAEPVTPASGQVIEQATTQVAEAAQPVQAEAQAGTATEGAPSQQAVETTQPVAPAEATEATAMQSTEAATAPEATPQADVARQAEAVQSAKPTETVEPQAEPVRVETTQHAVVDNRAEIVAQATEQATPDDGVNTVRVVNDLVRGVRASLDNGISRLQVTLDPPELGRVTLNLMVKEGSGLRIEIETRNDFARQAIEGRLDELQQALEKQGQQVISLDVRQRGGHGASARQGWATPEGDPAPAGGPTSPGATDGSSTDEIVEHAGYRLNRGRVLAGGRYNLFV